LEQLEKKKNKLFYAYEEEILSNDEFKERKEMLNKRTQELLEQKQPLLETLEDTVSDEIPYDYLKSILVNFCKILSESTSREQQKKLLHMLISEITINEQERLTK
jgi:site-specific DNA recombinase